MDKPKDKPIKGEKQEKQGGKQRTAAAVFVGTFGALPEVHFLHAIYHFKTQEVKNPTLQTVYDLELKRGRYGFRKTLLQVSNNLCMPYWIRDQEGRLVRIENPQDTELDICVNIMDPPPEDQNSQQGQGGNPMHISMRDRMHPPRMSAPSCIIPPLEQLIIRPHIVPLLPNFHGMESENPYAHIKEFEEVCNTFREGGASIDLMRLKLFPFTLKDKAKIWLNSLRPRSIRNWVDLQAEFLKKFFPTHRTNGLKRQISNFSAKENEKFHECWERYMEAINACPHHGFDTWLLNPEEAMDFLSYVSEVSRGWDEPNSREKGKFPLNQPKIQKVEYECPTMPAVREMLGDQANVVGQFRPNNNAPYGNTYNSSWRNHPNFSWKPRPPPYQPQAQTKHLNKPLQWSKPL
ncbi:hypothetical protein CK203_028379 [Vitis vinifera]|uniref:Retrotransposon gag domain-containing protein n=1 Tax=Vitis vinifera TaxID=29760 RepID=A0A438IZZ8_VITVI|nr:hypothetical protein CK203_028379 [Vitis vinifera]